MSLLGVKSLDFFLLLDHWQRNLLRKRRINHLFRTLWLQDLFGSKLALFTLLFLIELLLRIHAKLIQALLGLQQLFLDPLLVFGGAVDILIIILLILILV